MKIVQVHSHLGGLEFIQVHLPGTWAEIESAIVAVDGSDRKATTATATRNRRSYSPNRINAAIGRGLKSCGWKPRRAGALDFAKDRVGIEIQFGRSPRDTYDLLARHIASYLGKFIDVGIEILPMKELQAQMSSGVAYYEGELYNLIREGRGVPGVPLVLVGIAV